MVPRAVARRRRRWLATAFAMAVLATGCSSDADDGVTGATAPAETGSATDTGSDSATATDAASAAEQRFPDVVDAAATLDDDGTWTISATLSSPYDSPERYADAWRVVGPDGTVHGERILTHDHAAEQPFTRSQSGIEIPDDVDEVTIEGRDQRYGWGGATVTLVLPRPG